MRRRITLEDSGRILVQETNIKHCHDPDGSRKRKRRQRKIIVGCAKIVEENFNEKKSRPGSGQGIVEQRDVIANSETECRDEEVARGNEQRSEEKNREVQVDYQKNLSDSATAENRDVITSVHSIENNGSMVLKIQFKNSRNKYIATDSKQFKKFIPPWAGGKVTDGKEGEDEEDFEIVANSPNIDPKSIFDIPSQDIDKVRLEFGKLAADWKLGNVDELCEVREAQQEVYNLTNPQRIKVMRRYLLREKEKRKEKYLKFESFHWL